MSLRKFTWDFLIPKNLNLFKAKFLFKLTKKFFSHKIGIILWLTPHSSEQNPRKIPLYFISLEKGLVLSIIILPGIQSDLIPKVGKANECNTSFDLNTKIPDLGPGFPFSFQPQE